MDVRASGTGKKGGLQGSKEESSKLKTNLLKEIRKTYLDDYDLRELKKIVFYKVKKINDFI